MIKVSRTKTDVYEMTLNKLNDVDKLEVKFENMEELKQYIKEPSRVEVDLDHKVVIILTMV